MKAPEHGEEEGGEEGAAPPGWLVKEGTAALGGLLSEPALEYAVAQLFDVLQRAAGEQKDVADDLLRIAAQVSVAALNGGHTLRAKRGAAGQCFGQNFGSAGSESRR